MSRYTHPLAHGLSTVLDHGADVYRVGVAGGKGPLKWVVEDRRAAAREETSSLCASTNSQTVTGASHQSRD
jgi:hypothetical protein